MVWQSAPIADQCFTIGAAYQTIQQPVSMNVTGLFPVETEIDPAKPMNARLHAGPPTDLGFDFTDSTDAFRMKQTSHAE
jgi:hypothetical protein